MDTTTLGLIGLGLLLFTNSNSNNGGSTSSGLKPGTTASGKPQWETIFDQPIEYTPACDGCPEGVTPEGYQANLQNAYEKLPQLEAHGVHIPFNTGSWQWVMFILMWMPPDATNTGKKSAMNGVNKIYSNDLKVDSIAAMVL